MHHKYVTITACAHEQLLPPALAGLGSAHLAL
jgi:hypothetical protein